VPDDWERKPHPTEIFLAPKQQQENSKNAMFIMLSIQSCNNGPQFVVAESDFTKNATATPANDGDDALSWPKR